MSANAWVTVDESATASAWKPVSEDAPKEKPGFWATLGSDLKGMLTPTAQNPYPGMGLREKSQAALQAQTEDAAREKAGYSTPYRLLAPMAESIGVNVPGMEQAASEGNPGAVMGHAVAGAAPVAAFEAGKFAPDLVRASMDKIPSKERAGANFKEVMGSAKDVPVDLSNSQDAIIRLMDWQKKTQLGPTLNKFLNRVTDPKHGPLTYSEARDFYQLLGRMSADETMKMAPAIKYELTRTVAGLKTDIGNAAGSVGKAQQYYDAMKEFRNAKSLEDISDASKEIIVESLKRAVPYGIGTGIGTYGVKKLVDATR